MAGALTAIGNDIQSIYWNPAIGSMIKEERMSSGFSYYSGNTEGLSPRVYFNNFSILFPLEKFNIGFIYFTPINYAMSTKIDGYDMYGNPTGKFEIKYEMFIRKHGIHFSREFVNENFGIGINLYYNNIENSIKIADYVLTATADTFNFDLGIHYHPGEIFVLGLKYSNISKFTYKKDSYSDSSFSDGEIIPTELVIAMGLNCKKVKFGFDIFEIKWSENKEEDYTYYIGPSKYLPTNDWRGFRLGTEIDIYKKQVFLRLGIRRNFCTENSFYYYGSENIGLGIIRDKHGFDFGLSKLENHEFSINEGSYYSFRADFYLNY